MKYIKLCKFSFVYFVTKCLHINMYLIPQLYRYIVTPLLPKLEKKKTDLEKNCGSH